MADVRIGKVPRMLAQLKGGLLYDAHCAGGRRSSFRKMIYGATNSRYHEPIDQITAFLVAKDLQSLHPEARFLPLAVGKFGILNAREGDSIRRLNCELQVNTLRKQWFHCAVMDYFQVKGTVFLTDNFWDDPCHWEIAERIFENNPSIVPKENPFPGSYYKFSKIMPLFAHAIHSSFSAKLAEIDAPRLYTLIETAHVKYLAEHYGADSKLGSISELHFDRFIESFMDIAHLRQPTDLGAYAGRVRTVMPYIGKATENRIYFADDKETILLKLRSAEVRCADDPPFYYDEKTKSEVLNPLVQYAIYGVEAGRLVVGKPSSIAGNEVSCGLDVIELAEEKGVRDWAPDVAKLLWQHVVKPIDGLMRTRWNFERELARARQADANEMMRRLDAISRETAEKEGAAKPFSIWRVEFE